MFYVKSANNGNKLCIISLSQCQHSQQVAVAVGEEEEGVGEGGGGEWELKLQLDSFDGYQGIGTRMLSESVLSAVCCVCISNGINYFIVCDL